MLSEFRKLGDTFIAKILFGLLLVSFVAWGVSDVFKSGTGVNDAARVGNVKIPLLELDRSYRQYLSNLRAHGMEMSSDQARSMQLAESVLKARVQRELFSQVSEDMHLIVNDDIVANEIRKQKAFQNDKGVFDRAKYNQILKQNNLREADYAENLRLDTANNFLESVLKTSTLVPNTEVDALYQYQNETRSADVRVLNFAVVKDVTAPKDDQLTAYLKDHQEKYKQPEMRSFTIGVLSVPDLAKTIPVSEGDIQTAYDAHKVELTTAEERNIQFIALADQKTAQSVAESARGGEKLLDAAKAHGAANVKLVNLKAVKPGSLPKELDKVVFSLGRAETSDALQTPLGWYVVQVLNIKKGELPPLKTLHDKIKQTIQLSKADSIVAKTTTDIDDAIAGGASLQELAKNYPLHLADVKDVSETGTHVDGSQEKTLSKEILKTAYSTESSQTSALEQIKDGDYMIVRVNDIKKERTPGLAEIKSKVIADWFGEEREHITKQRADELQKAWSKNGNIDDLAKKYGAQSGTVSAIKRDSKDSNATVSPDLTLALFNLKKQGDVATGRLKDGIAVAKLTNITKGSADKSADLKTLHDQLAEQKQNSIFDAFLRDAETRHKVSVNNDAVQRLYQH